MGFRRLLHRCGAANFHLGMTVLWGALAIPTLLWWKDSILWVALMSEYANTVGHWSSYQAAHAEANSPSTEQHEELLAEVRAARREIADLRSAVEKLARVA